MMDKLEVSGLMLMRSAFAENQVSKLPKPTKAQTDAVKADYKQGFRCPDCKGWHHPKVDHLDYVGHAALTDRLLECDSTWDWQPMTLADNGLPQFDQSGGLWIKLTVCGVTRLGYGNAASKPAYGPGDREKELIGDALRNAAMRFGAALDLWHKGELHVSDDDDSNVATKPPVAKDVMIKSETRDFIISLANAVAFNIMDITKAYGVKQLTDLTEKQGQASINALNKKIDEQRINDAGKEDKLQCNQ